MRILNKNATDDTPINASALLLDLFFDVISDLTFGQSFDALTQHRRNPFIEEFLKQHMAIGYIIQNMWILSLIRSIPVVRNHFEQWLTFFREALNKRANVSVFIHP